MAKISKECLDGALEALKHFSREDLQNYVQDVFARARKMSDVKNMRAFDRAMKEINDENARAFFEDATIKANNTLKFDNQADKLRTGKVDMRSLLTKRYNNLGDNIASAQKAAAGRLQQFMFRDFTYDEMEFFDNAKNDEMIADAFDGKKVSDPTAQKIADKLAKYFDYRNSEMVISNAMRFDQISEDRMFRQIHDSGRLISGGRSLINAAKDRLNKKYESINAKETWRETIKKYLDMEATFSRTKAVDLEGNLHEDIADQMLDNIYDNITTGRTEIFTKSAVVNDREAVARKSRMFFKYKDMRSFLEYNKIYGKGNLFSALRSDMLASGNKIGMAERWGDSPYNIYNDLRNVQNSVNEKGGFWWSNTDNYFKSIMGLDKSSKSASASTMMSNIRSLTSMARLVQLSLQSVSDIGYIASFAQRMGIGYGRAYLNQLRHIFDRYPTEERRYIAKLFKGMVDSHLGYMGRWTDANNSSEIMNKISTKYFKAIGLEAFDRGNKVGIMHLMAQHLYQNSDKTLNEMNGSLSKWISKFMDEKEWDALRKNNNGKLFTTDNVDNMSDDAIKQLHTEMGLKTPLYQYRNDLYRKVYSMFNVASENAVLSPTEFERAWCFQGEAPGTLKGEFLRTVSQFKMYTLSYIDRVLVNGWRDADTPQQKIMWATSMLMGTIPLSLLSTYLGNLANGVSMPDWDLMNVPDREKFLVNLLAPSLAIFSGVVDPNNQNSDMVWSLFGSPATRLIGNTMASASALVTGNPQKAGKKLADAANYLIPLQNLPGISPYIRQAMGQQAHLDPGQIRLYGQ